MVAPIASPEPFGQLALWSTGSRVNGRDAGRPLDTGANTPDFGVHNPTLRQSACLCAIAKPRGPFYDAPQRMGA